MTRGTRLWETRAVLAAAAAAEMALLPFLLVLQYNATIINLRVTTAILSKRNPQSSSLPNQ